MKDVQPLEYQAPTPPRHDPLTATLLMLPGAICWFWLVLVGLNVAGLHVPRPTLRIIETFDYIMWMIALLTAIASCILYLPRRARPRPWFVILNLLVNISGLIFTVITILA